MIHCFVSLSIEPQGSICHHSGYHFIGGGGGGGGEGVMVFQLSNVPSTYGVEGLNWQRGYV